VHDLLHTNILGHEDHDQWCGSSVWIHDQILCRLLSKGQSFQKYLLGF